MVHPDFRQNSLNVVILGPTKDKQDEALEWVLWV